ncbi:MAG: DUF4388 domain-containing protein [Deltaproteobacteria bacterium]|nr:DUF4388 domain-containing protein [Deltaproteobacteria bacterium]
MTLEDADVVVGEDASITPRTVAAATKLRGRAGFYRLISTPRDVLIFRRIDPSSSHRMALSGEIIERSTLLEIVQFVANVGWTGELVVQGEDARRSIIFEGPTVLLASSNAPSERLGEVLFRHGALTRAQFDEAVRLVSPAQRLGDIIVRRGWMKPNDLYAMLQTQVREIFFNALSCDSGHFYFERGLDAATLPVRVNLACAGLLMEAVQRIDEWAYFREKIPNDDVIPMAILGRSADGDEQAARLLAAMDGRSRLVDLARVVGLGEFEAAKALFALLQNGAAQLKKPGSPKEQLEEQLEGFNSVLLDIHAVVDKAGVGEGARGTLAMFLQGGGAFDVLFANAGPRVDGGFDVITLMHNLQRLHTDDPGKVVQQALHDYVAFALFAAGSVLRREDHQELARSVQEQLSQLRIATG